MKFIIYDNKAMDISVFDVYTTEMKNNGLICVDVVDDNADVYGIGCEWLEANVFGTAVAEGTNTIIVDGLRIEAAIHESEGTVKGVYPEYFV